MSPFFPYQNVRLEQRSSDDPPVRATEEGGGKLECPLPRDTFTGIKYFEALCFLRASSRPSFWRFALFFFEDSKSVTYLFAVVFPN